MKFPIFLELGIIIVLKEITDMQLSEVIKQLSESANLISAKNAESIVPYDSGLYAIFIDNPTNLPSPFREYLIQKGGSMIYLGKASSSLQERLVEQDLRHRNPSTFFRGIGAILGFRPPGGSLRGKGNQNNYKFSGRDTMSIIEWINSHLSVRCVVLEANEIESYEPSAIESLKPLLNTSNNPDKLSELADLREECRRIARS